MTQLVRSRADFAAARSGLRGRTGAVLTMGALHAGHAALFDAARRGSERVVATVFVNPLQFGSGEDLGRYPRTLDADVRVADEHGVDLLWAPAVEDVYAAGDAQVTVDPGPLGRELEGALRPGHFAGMLTVVAKLFNIIRPDASWFGEKDYQQLVLIRRMVADLDLGVDVHGVTTVREPDGLALSSRNAYLDAQERTLASALSRALRTGSYDGALGVLAEHPQIVVDYVALRADDLGPGAERLLVAARLGTTRLIDNMQVPR